MSSTKRNSTHLQRAVGLFALVFLLLLNARADQPPMDVAKAIKEFGITPEQYQALAKHSKELGQEYELAIKSPEGASQLQATLRKAIANIDAASTPLTSDENKLPTSFIALFYSKKPRVEPEPVTYIMAKPGFMGLKVDNLLDQQTLSLAAHLINSHPEILLPVLQERAKVSPPTAADYILYGEILEGLGDDNPENDPSQVPLTQAAGLLKLAQAKNPLYRLLAVKAAPFVEPNETNRVNFYSAFLNETDPTIQTQAMFGVAQTKTPTTVSVLQSFQTAARQSGNTEGANEAQKAIQRLQK